VKTLVLFDIDGTLLDTRGAGRRSFVEALRRVFPFRDGLEDLRFAGATDLDLVEKIARRNGHMPAAEELRAFFNLLPDLLREELRVEPPHVYPGVRELLAALSARAETTIGLVTGNIEACAWIKLEACGIRGHFELGAFGHEHADRREIARLACTRAEREGPFSRRILIGDTPSDVIAARAIGATAIAVATGGYDVAALAAAGAQRVWTDLSDTASVLAHLDDAAAA
jgi:phosphoglycolate phosphatase-like HAD superfamily hydrolase